MTDVVVQDVVPSNETPEEKPNASTGEAPSSSSVDPEPSILPPVEPTPKAKAAPKKRGRPTVPDEEKSYVPKRKTQCPGCGSVMTEHQLRFKHKCPAAHPVPSAPTPAPTPVEPEPKKKVRVDVEEEPVNVDRLIYDYMKQRKEQQLQTKRARYSMFVSSFA